MIGISRMVSCSDPSLENAAKTAETMIDPTATASATHFITPPICCAVCEPRSSDDRPVSSLGDRRGDIADPVLEPRHDRVEHGLGGAADHGARGVGDPVDRVETDCQHRQGADQATNVTICDADATITKAITPFITDDFSSGDMPPP